MTSPPLFSPPDSLSGGSDMKEADNIWNDCKI